MTTATTPHRAGQRGGRNSFGQLLRAEWTKFRTVRGWLVGMAVAALLMVLVGLFGTGTSSNNCGSGGPTGQSGRACLIRLPLGPDGEAVTDSFYFVRQPLAGDGSITVRVTALTGLIPAANASGRIAVGQGPLRGMRHGLDQWAKAGLIIKESTRQGSAYAAIMVTGGHGVRMQYNYTHDTAGQPGLVSAAAPRWLRLTRTGDTLTGYESADGGQWTEVGAASLAGLSSTVQAGLFVTSPNYSQVTEQHIAFSSSAGGPTQATAVFDHVSLRGSRPRGGWTGSDIGGQAAYLAAPEPGGFHQAGGRFTVTGSGDIGPAVPGGSGGPTATIEDHLVGAFAGLIAVIVVAVMFITAEYRRRLIRTTFAATPRRGRVLAAKAIVAGVVTFVVGLAAAVVAVTFGPQLSRDQGSYVFPVTTLTEVRVVIGTAALLAVAAVLALAIGVALRRSAAAVTAVIMAIVLPYLLAVAAVLPSGPADWLLRVTPAAAFAIQQSIPLYPQVSGRYTPSNGYFPLAPWAGFAVLCGWTAVALGLAFFLLRRRDA